MTRTNIRRSGIVASIIRAKIFFGTAAFSDETMASVDLIGWSIIETSVYIITNCLPHLRPLVSHYAPECIKRALKSSLASLGTYGDPTGKGKSGGPSTTTKMSGLKSFGHSVRRSPDGRSHDDDYEDDTIELTHQRAEQGLNSPVDGSPWRAGSSHSPAPSSWDGVPVGGSDGRGHMASKVECSRSAGDAFHGGSAGPGLSGLGSITVTREVKLTRS